MKSNRLFARSQLLGSVMTAALVVGSFAIADVAQAQGDEGGGGIETMIVTATFRETNLQNTPLAITAVNAAMLEARSQTNVVEVAAQAPNVTLRPHGQAFGASLVAFIRGVGQTDFNYASEPGVGVYVDDVYYATITGNLLDLLDLDRVEILRGPQGTLAGKNSIGGAIKLFTRLPDAEGGGSLQASYGRFNRVDFRGSTGFTLAEDKLFVRIAGAARSRDGYVTRLDYACMHPGTPAGFPQNHVGKGCEIGTEGGQSYVSGRIAFRWTPTADFDVNLAFDITNDKSEVQPGVLVRSTMFDPAFVLPIWGPPIAGFPISSSVSPVPIYYDANGDGLLNPALGDIPYDNRFVTHGAFRGDTAPTDGYTSYANYLDTGFPPRIDCALINPFILPNPPFACKDLNHFKSGGVAVPPINHFRGWGGALNILWNINDRFSINSISSYRYYTNSFANDDDASPLAVQQLLQTLHHDQWSQEVRLNGTVFNDALDFTVGGFYQTQDGTLEARVDLPYIAFDFIHGPDPTPSSNKAVFATATAHFWDKLDFSAGGRFSEDVKDYTFHRHNPIGGTVPVTPCLIAPWINIEADNCAVAGGAGVPLDGISAHFESRRWDYRMALSWFVTDNFTVYGQTSTGYKGGGVDARPFVPDQVVTFNPESLTAYEAGIKTTLFDKVRFNGAYFYNVYKGVQLIRTNCTGISLSSTCLMPINGGDAHVWGLEGEVLAQVTDAFSIDAAYSYLHFRYTRITDPSTLVTIGMVTPYTPANKWSVGAQYRIDLDGLGSITPRIDASYQSHVFTLATNAPENKIEGYTLANARVTWRGEDEKWEAAVEVTNFMDKYFYYTLNDLSTQAGFVQGQPGRPREFAITVKRKF